MIGCIVQARTSSSRLPKKVLLEIEDKKTILDFVIMQLKSCKNIDKIVIATTDLSEDDVIVDASKNLNVKCFRGNINDVLDRYYQCANKFGFSTIVRIPSDKPLIDPQIVDDVIEKYKINSYDYISNFQPYSFPYGTEVEIFSFKALETAWNNARLPSEREHVTPYIIHNQDIFSKYNVTNSKNLSNFRWAVDRQDDLILVRKIVSMIKKRPILLTDILSIMNEHPELSEINKKVKRDEGIEKSLEEDKKFLERQDRS